MTAAFKKIQHLVERSRAAQSKRDCEGAYRSLIQAVKAYGFALGAGTLSPDEGRIQAQLMDCIDEVFDGCIGR